METKKAMFVEVEIIPNGYDAFCRFYWKLQGDKEPCHIDNPDAKWLMDFVSADKPYIVIGSDFNDDWRQAFCCAIASESRPAIISALKANGTISDDYLCNIFSNTIEKYNPELAKAWLINSEDFLNYIDIPAKKAWEWKGE